MSMANTVMKNSRGPYVLTEVKIFANLTIRFLIQRGMHVIFGFFPNTSKACNAISFCVSISGPRDLTCF